VFVRTTKDHAVAAGHSLELAGWQVIFNELTGRIAGRFGRVEPRPTARDYLQGLLSGIECKTAGTWPSMPGMPVRRRCSACCAPHVRRLPIRHVALNVIPRCPGARSRPLRRRIGGAAEIRRRDGTQIYLTGEPGEDGPEGFYRKLGFQLTAEKSEGQTVGMLDLTNA